MPLQLQSSLIDRIKEAQASDKLQKFRDQVEIGFENWLDSSWDRSLRYGARLCVPKGDVRQKLLTEAFNSPYSIHPDVTKMYQDLNQLFCWHGMKKKTARFVSKCLACQQVKVKHQRIVGLLQLLPIPEWKWEHITIDLVTALPRSLKGHNAIWVIGIDWRKALTLYPLEWGQSTETLAEYYMQEMVRLYGGTGEHCVRSWHEIPIPLMAVYRLISEVSWNSVPLIIPRQMGSQRELYKC